MNRGEWPCGPSLTLLQSHRNPRTQMEPILMSASQEPGTWEEGRPHTKRAASGPKPQVRWSSLAPKQFLEMGVRCHVGLRFKAQEPQLSWIGPAAGGWGDKERADFSCLGGSPSAPPTPGPNLTTGREKWSSDKPRSITRSVQQNSGSPGGSSSRASAEGTGMEGSRERKKNLPFPQE